MRTFLKAHQVSFPMPQVSSHLGFAIKSYAWISQDCSEGQQSVMTECWNKLPCKTEPIYNVSWCMAYSVGKLLESSFTPKKWFVIWTSQ